MNNRVKFLLVDDIEENLVALEALLSQDGLDIHKARSGPEALELLLLHDFALALIDVQMPGMDGFELAELMRGTARTRRVPIILLTAGGVDEQRRFKGYEAGAVDYLVKPIDAHMLRRKAEVFFQLDRQRRDLLRQRDELEASERRFRTSLMLAPTPVLLVDERGTVQAVNAEWLSSTGHAEQELPTLEAWMRRLCGAQAEEVLARIGEVVQGALERTRIEAEVLTADGEALTWTLVVSAVGVGADGRRLFLCVAHDVTERARAEHTRQLLVAELNHRVKNNLATVLAIARQTLRQTRDPDRFEASFMGRLLALSRAHALLSDETWQGAELADLLRDQLALGSVDETRFTRSGPPVRLPPQISLHVALMLHELLTNAVKYGAFSVPGGRVAVSWTSQAGQLRLHWEERGGPPVQQPERRGFGSTLIERSARACAGSATPRYAPEGLSWDIVLWLTGPPAEKAAPPVEPMAPPTGILVK